MLYAHYNRQQTRTPRNEAPELKIGKNRCPFELPNTVSSACSSLSSISCLFVHKHSCLILFREFILMRQQCVHIPCKAIESQLLCI